MDWPRPNVSLQIDGDRCDPAVVWCHHQDDPYPGGHSYCLEMERSPVVELFQDFPVGIHRSSSKLSSVFAFLHTLLPSSGGAFEYVLNTVDTLTVDSDTLTFRGICSEFIRSDANT